MVGLGFCWLTLWCAGTIELLMPLTQGGDAIELSILVISPAKERWPGLVPSIVPVHWPQPEGQKTQYWVPPPYISGGRQIGAWLPAAWSNYDIKLKGIFSQMRMRNYWPYLNYLIIFWLISDPCHLVIFSCIPLPIDDVPTWCQSSDNSCQLAIDSWQLIDDTCITTVVYQIALQIILYTILISQKIMLTIVTWPPPPLHHPSSISHLLPTPPPPPKRWRNLSKAP